MSLYIINNDMLNQYCKLVKFILRDFMNLEIAIDQARKTKLKNYLEDNKNKYKSLTEFAKFVGLFASNLSPILNGEKKFTDKLAKTLEDKLGLESGFFSTVVASNNSDILIPYRRLKQGQNHKKVLLAEDGTFISLEASSISSKYKVDNLFALHPDFDLDKESLNKSIDKSKSLIFDMSDTAPVLDKIYLIYFADKLLLRRYTIVNDVKFFDTDSSLYSKITADGDDVEVIARLVYSVSLKEY